MARTGKSTPVILATALLTLLGFFSLGDALAQSSPNAITYTFSACIDGRDLLIVQGNTLQWQHLDFQPVGDNGNCTSDESTSIVTTNNGSQVLSTNWLPSWPDPSNVPSGTFSSKFTGLLPALPPNASVTLTVLEARNSLTILQQPSAANNGTLILDFNDDPEAGAAQYTAKVTVGCNVNPDDVLPQAIGPFSAKGKPTTMEAQFTPLDSNGNPIGLSALASTCGFIGFDYQQQVTSLPPPSPFFAVTSPDVPLLAPPSFSDPVPGGYTYAPSSNFYPFYAPVDAGLDAQTPCIDDPSIQIANTRAMQDCPADPLLLPGGKVSFTTSLVGVLAGPPSTPSQPFKTWTWTSNFNGTVAQGGSNTGGVQLLSVSPIDPSSGTGGVIITSIDGVKQTPPSVSCSATPSTLWPPNSKTVPVTVSGQITEGTQTTASGVTSFSVTDSQSTARQNGTVMTNTDGTFSFSVPLVASRAGNVQSGRQYTISVTANDAIGNQGSCSAVVTVPHDQGN